MRPGRNSINSIQSAFSDTVDYAESPSVFNVEQNALGLRQGATMSNARLEEISRKKAQEAHVND